MNYKGLIFGSRTLDFNVLVAVLAAAADNLPMLQGVIPITWYPWILVGVNVANALLRTITTKPLKGFES